MDVRRRKTVVLAVAVGLAALLAAAALVCRCQRSDVGGETTPAASENDAGGRGDPNQGDESSGAVSDGTDARREEDALDAADVRGSLTSFAVCDAAGTLVGSKAGAVGVRATWEMRAGPTECAREVLAAYEAAGLSLRYDGYIDLLGRVWGCAVWSEEGWAEVVLVDGRDGEGNGSGERCQEERCELTVARFGPVSGKSEDGRG